MQIRERHGRKGQAQEYYEFSFRTPRFVAQRCGDYWIAGYTHQDGHWWFAPAQYASPALARAAAQQWATIYAQTGTLPSTSIADDDDDDDENPYDHDSSYSGCAAGCQACAWDDLYPRWTDLPAHNTEA